MATQQQFLDLLRDIEPSQSTVAACSGAHTTLRDRLASHETYQDIHVDTYLSGSYARDTALRPRTIDGKAKRPDIDIILVTNQSQNDAPADVVRAVYKVIKKCGYEAVTENRRSVNVQLTTADMDVVPIIENPYGDGYLIPDKELGAWLTTNPLGHTQWGRKVNRESGGMFKPQVKLLKWWRRENLPNLRRPKGFIMECLVAKHMDFSQSGHEALFVNLLERIADAYSMQALLGQVPELEDPSVPGNNVFSSVTVEEFKRFHDKVTAHATLARRAQEAIDPDKSYELWQKVLGPRFPRAGSRSGGLLRPAVAAALTFPPTPVLPNKPQGFA